MLICNFQSSLRKKNILMQFSKFFEKKCLYILLPIKAKMQFSKFQSSLKKKCLYILGLTIQRLICNFESSLRKTNVFMQFSKFFEKKMFLYSLAVNMQFLMFLIKNVCIFWTANMQFSKFFEKKCLYILWPTKANMQFSKFFEKKKYFYAIFKVLWKKNVCIIWSG
jgi:hypothetical protein